MKKLLLAINWKLFYQSERRPVGAMIAAVQAGSIRLAWTEYPTGSDLPLPQLNGILEVVRRHVQEYLRDSRYISFWNEDTGIETNITELP